MLCFFIEMDGNSLSTFFIAVFFSVCTLPLISCRTIPFGLSSLSSKGSAIPLPLKWKDLKRDWCVGRSMMQKVHHHGCNSTEVKTKLCFGQCMTYFVQLSSHSPFSTCSQCTPSRIESTEVKLKCADGTTKKKKVPVVKRCSCMTCNYARFYMSAMLRNL